MRPAPEAMQRGYERRGRRQRGGRRAPRPAWCVTLDLRDDSADAAALETATQALVEAGAHVVITTPADVRAGRPGRHHRTGRPAAGRQRDRPPGLPGKRMQWMVLRGRVANPEARAREVVSATLAAIARADRSTPRVRAALQEPQTSR
jgi:hypothetical protein